MELCLVLISSSNHDCFLWPEMLQDRNISVLKQNSNVLFLNILYVKSFTYKKDFIGLVEIPLSDSGILLFLMDNVQQ